MQCTQEAYSQVAGDFSGPTRELLCRAGPLPPQWANLTKLSTLELQRNNLEGEAA